MTTHLKSKAPPAIIGWKEEIGLPELGIAQLDAKIDTGARTTALHATRIEPFDKDGARWVRFRLKLQGRGKAVICEVPLADDRLFKNTSGREEHRYTIRTRLQIGGRSWQIEVALADRSNMTLPIILGRSAIRRHNLLVDAGRSFLLGPPTRKLGRAARAGSKNEQDAGAMRASKGHV